MKMVARDIETFHMPWAHGLFLMVQYGCLSASYQVQNQSPKKKWACCSLQEHILKVIPFAHFNLIGQNVSHDDTYLSRKIVFIPDQMLS